MLEMHSGEKKMNFWQLVQALIQLDFGMAYTITPQKGKIQFTKGMKNLYTTFLWLY